MKRLFLIAAATTGLAACSDAPATPDAGNGVLAQGPETDISDVAAADLPQPLTALIQQTVPGMQVEEAERKEREGRVYYDVEGTRPDGSEVELDIMEEGGAYRVVEIQRDIAFADAPQPVVQAARAAPGFFEPARVIESRQTDGTIIYELFAPGRTDEPAMEVSLKDGQARLLTERWAH